MLEVLVEVVSFDRAHRAVVDLGRRLAGNRKCFVETRVGRRGVAGSVATL